VFVQWEGHHLNQRNMGWQRGRLHAFLPFELSIPLFPSTVIASANRWGTWLRLADFLNLDYDLIPSLHVAMFVTTAGAYACQSGGLGRVVLRLWAAAVVASTVLTHQHHLIDAVAGLALVRGGARIAVQGPRRTQAGDTRASP